jgi:hypothetical protein
VATARRDLRSPGIAPAQPLGQGDQLRVHLLMRPMALAFAVPSALALPSGLELGHEARFLELRDGAQHLRHQNSACWRGQRQGCARVCRRRHHEGGRERRQWLVVAGSMTRCGIAGETHPRSKSGKGALPAYELHRPAGDQGQGSASQGQGTSTATVRAVIKPYVAP